MSSRFSDQILKVMSVSGYHAGDDILVEVDIGMSFPSLHPYPISLHPSFIPLSSHSLYSSPSIPFVLFSSSFNPICLILCIVLDEKMPLRDVHDLGEALQYSIESLAGVERAFVHCDYQVSNPSGHIRRRG